MTKQIPVLKHEVALTGETIKILDRYFTATGTKTYDEAIVRLVRLDRLARERMQEKPICAYTGCSRHVDGTYCGKHTIQITDRTTL